MNIIKFIFKFFIVALLAWVGIWVLDFAICMISLIGKFLNLVLIALCVYLVVSGDYKKVNKFAENIIAKIKDYAESESEKTA